MARRRKQNFIERRFESIERLASPVIDNKAKFRNRLRVDRTVERATGGRQRPDGGAILERLVGKDDTLPFYVLELGAQLGRAVCKIAIEGSGGEGTGFLVGTDLLLTNNHVLPTPQKADAARCIFDFELGLDRVSRASAAYRLDSASLFLTSDSTTVWIIRSCGSTLPLRGTANPSRYGADHSGRRRMSAYSLCNILKVN